MRREKEIKLEFDAIKTLIWRTPFVVAKNGEFSDSSAAGGKFENLNLGWRGHSIPKRIDNFCSVWKFSELMGNYQLDDR